MKRTIESRTAKAAILRQMREPLVNVVLSEAARMLPGMAYPELVEYMWELVEDGELSYGADARLRIPHNTDA